MARELNALSRLDCGVGCRDLTEHRAFKIRELPRAGGRYWLSRCAICGVYLLADLANGSAMWEGERLIPCDANGTPTDTGQ